MLQWRKKNLLEHKWLRTLQFYSIQKRSFFQRAVKSRKNNWEGKREVWCETYLLEVGIKVLVMILTHKSKLLRSAVYPFEVSGVFNYFWSGSTSFSQAPSRVKVVSIFRSHNVRMEFVYTIAIHVRDVCFPWGDLSSTNKRTTRVVATFQKRMQFNVWSMPRIF